MAGSMQIDPAVLEEIHGRLTTVGADFAALADEFVAKMEGMADAYGSDETGGLILAIHQEVMTAFQECLQDAGADIEAAAATLGDVGAAVREMDDLIASGFNSLLGELG